jgi:hypothetical protein
MGMHKGGVNVQLHIIRIGLESKQVLEHKNNLKSAPKSIQILTKSLMLSGDRNKTWISNRKSAAVDMWGSGY